MRRRSPSDPQAAHFRNRGLIAPFGQAGRYVGIVLGQDVARGTKLPHGRDEGRGRTCWPRLGSAEVREASIHSWTSRADRPGEAARKGRLTTHSTTAGTGAEMHLSNRMILQWRHSRTGEVVWCTAKSYKGTADSDGVAVLPPFWAFPPKTSAAPRGRLFLVLSIGRSRVLAIAQAQLRDKCGVAPIYCISLRILHEPAGSRRILRPESEFCAPVHRRAVRFRGGVVTPPHSSADLGRP